MENSLGLIGDDDDLIIDYDYYKWVMMNYDKQEHIYYLNCVSKHKRGIPKPRGLQNKKRKEDEGEDDSDFIREMGWDMETDELDFSEFEDIK